MSFQKERLYSHSSLGKKALTGVLIYLLILYGATTVVIFPERLPKMILPYLLIFLWYLGRSWSPLGRSIYSSECCSEGPVFSQNELGIFAIILILSYHCL